MVSGPDPPEADLILVATEVRGVEIAEVGRSEPVEDERTSEEGEEVTAEELAREVDELPIELARPVTVDIVGFEDA